LKELLATPIEMVVMLLLYINSLLFGVQYTLEKLEEERDE
jgi:hypothetical protein|tara:strand:- start:634 stop:753 length:120 start_codon:yes stop_codon:yes gene_type:complete